MSFFKKIAKPLIGAIAAPFTGGASLLPTLIGGGGVIAGSLLGNTAGGQAGALAGQGQDMLSSLQGLAAPALQQAIGFNQRLLSGDTRALNPELRRANILFDQARNRLTNNAVARGGGLSRALGNVESGRALTLNDILFGAQQTAAQNLGNLGTAGFGNAASILGAASGAAQSADQNRAAASDLYGGMFTNILQGVFDRGAKPQSTSGGGRLQFPPGGVFSRTSPPPNFPGVGITGINGQRLFDLTRPR